MQRLLPKKSDYGCNQLEKALGLYTTRTTTNMNLFDSKQQLKKFCTVYDIIDSYYVVRHDLYIKRKAHQIQVIEQQLIKISNRAKFIQEQIDEPPTLVLRKKKKKEVILLLKSKNYDVIDGDKEYKYLRTMPIDSVEEENVAKLLTERGNKSAALVLLKDKSIGEMWLEELVELSQQYNIYRNARIRRAAGATKKKVKKVKRVIIKKLT
jgi:DNA topoisomerase-2